MAYASRSLMPTERDYALIESLTLIFGVKRFHNYVYGRSFTLVIDHKPHTMILGNKNGIPPLAAARIQRWALIFSAYKYMLEFRCSQEHGNADALSRLSIFAKQEAETGALAAHLFNVRQLETLPVTSKEIAQATRKDPVLSRVMMYTWEGWPHECHNKNK